MRVLLALTLLIPALASAEESFVYEDVEWLRIDPRYPEAAAPMAGWLSLDVVDARPIEQRRDPNLIGQDSGVGFDLWFVVSAETDAVKPEEGNAVDLVVDALAAAARHQGARVHEGLPVPAPRLKAAIRAFWCDEPGDEDQDCRVEVALSLWAPGADTAGWSDVLSWEIRQGEGRDREDSYTEMLQALSFEARKAFKEAHLNALVSMHTDAVEAAMGGWVPRPGPTGRPRLVLVDDEGRGLDPKGHGDVPRFRDRRMDLYIVSEHDRKAALGGTELTLRFEGGQLADMSTELLNLYAARAEEGRSRFQGGAIAAGVGAVLVLTAVGLSAAARNGLFVEQSAAIGVPLGFGVAGGITLGIGFPSMIHGGAEWSEYARHTDRLEAGQLRAFQAPRTLVREVRRVNRGG
jgi:hypothetical protein